jgi:hypothetical protein
VAGRRLGGERLDSVDRVPAWSLAGHRSGPRGERTSAELARAHLVCSRTPWLAV